MKLSSSIEKAKKEWILSNIQNSDNPEKDDPLLKIIFSKTSTSQRKFKNASKGGKFMIVVGGFGPYKGFGHLIRSILIYKSLMKNKKKGWIIISNLRERNLLKKLKIPSFMITELDLTGKDSLITKREKELGKIIDKTNVDLIISEEDIISPILAKEKKKYCIGLFGSELYFPLYPIFFACDEIISTESIDKIQKSISLLEKREIYHKKMPIEIIGKLGRLSNTEVSSKIKKEYGKFALVTLGGSINKNANMDLEKIIEYLSSAYPHKILVAGEGKNKEKVHFIGSPLNLPDYMKASEIVLSHAGLVTTTEILMNRVPGLILALDTLEQKINSKEMALLGYPIDKMGIKKDKFIEKIKLLKNFKAKKIKNNLFFNDKKFNMILES